MVKDKADASYKKAGVTMSILDKIDRRHTILNIYVPNRRTSKYTKPKLMNM